MLVPAVLKESTSPSPAKVLPTDTAAFTSVRLSGSLTDRVGDTVTAAAFSVKLVTPVTEVSVGASLTAVRLTVSVCVVLRLNDPEPSLSTQVTVRVVLEPKLVGLRLVELKVSPSST